MPSTAFIVWARVHRLGSGFEKHKRPSSRSIPAQRVVLFVLPLLLLLVMSGVSVLYHASTKGTPLLLPLEGMDGANWISCLKGLA